jgi:hypothetical protein
MNHSSQTTTAPQVIELEQIFLFLEEKGKETFGPSFAINPKDYPLIFKLMIYFYRDTYHAENTTSTSARASSSADRSAAEKPAS